MSQNAAIVHAVLPDAPDRHLQHLQAEPIGEFAAFYQETCAAGRNSFFWFLLLANAGFAMTMCIAMLANLLLTLAQHVVKLQLIGIDRSDTCCVNPPQMHQLTTG